MKHNIWTTIKPTVTESCLLVTMTDGDYYAFELIYDDGDVIPIYECEEWGLWSDLTASQYLTLKLAP